MQTHQLKPNHKSADRKIVGRGGKKGTYSGKGGKGQTARAGRKLAPIIRELIKRYPKLKGYRAERFGKKIATVNLASLEKKFADGSKITSQNVGQVKILGTGAVTKKFHVKGVALSQSAKAIIEKAGGTVKS